MIYGIDISHHNKPSTVPYADSDFIIMKATEGKTFSDKKMLEHYNNAKAFGKEVGFYHYARPENNTVEDEVARFVGTLSRDNLIGKGILALDWEDKALTQPITWARLWLDEVYALTGIRPLFYCQWSFTSSKNISLIREGNYGLWVARYYKNTGMPDNRGCKPLDEKSRAMWQYTSNPIDRDIFYGSVEQFRKYYKK